MRHLHVNAFNSKGCIIDPKSSRKSVFLFAFGSEGDFITPHIIDPGTIEQEILVKVQTKTCNGTHEVLLKQVDIVVIDIHILNQVAKKLRITGVIYSGDLVSLDFFDRSFWILTIENIRKGLRYKYW